MLFRRPPAAPSSTFSGSAFDSNDDDINTSNKSTFRRAVDDGVVGVGKQQLRWNLRSQRGLFICLLWLVVVHWIHRQLMMPQPPLSLPSQREPYELPQTKIHAIAVFKEESHALVEVLLNLYSQGVHHVLLIDNDSQHALPMDVLDHMQNTMGFVTLRHRRGKAIQKSAFRWATQWSRWQGADWILQFDADEFPWATQLGSLQSYLTLRDAEVCSVAFPWRLFGSDGREVQPNSIVHGFVGRFNFTTHRPQQSAYKTAARTSCSLLWMAIHHAALMPRDSRRGYSATDGFPNQDSPILDGRTETFRPDVLINHYRLQSRQFFLQIKQLRGLPNNNGKVRDEKSFRGGDKNDTVDYELIHKVNARFPSLYEIHGSSESEIRSVSSSSSSSSSLALQPNSDFTSPWPLSNVLAALEELKRHQVLVIMDAAQSLPDALSTATRNAAILDPTLDCVVRIPPGHIQSVMASQVLEFCKAYPAFPETQSWDAFVQARRTEFSHYYRGFAVLDRGVRLAYGMETAPLRRAAMMADPTKWTRWTQTHDEEVQGGRIHVNGNTPFEP